MSVETLLTLIAALAGAWAARRRWRPRWAVATAVATLILGPMVAVLVTSRAISGRVSPVAEVCAVGAVVSALALAVTHMFQPRLGDGAAALAMAGVAVFLVGVVVATAPRGDRHRAGGRWLVP